MLETERNSVIIGLQKIADTRSVSWWKRNVCLKASEMLRAVVDGRIENRRGHLFQIPSKLDKQYYIDLAKKRLEDFGV